MVRQNTIPSGFEFEIMSERTSASRRRSSESRVLRCGSDAGDDLLDLDGRNYAEGVGLAFFKKPGHPGTTPPGHCAALYGRPIVTYIFPSGLGK